MFLKFYENLPEFYRNLPNSARVETHGRRAPSGAERRHFLETTACNCTRPVCFLLAHAAPLSRLNGRSPRPATTKPCGSWSFGGQTMNLRGVATTRMSDPAFFCHVRSISPTYGLIPSGTCLATQRSNCVPASCEPHQLLADRVPSSAEEDLLG